MRVLITRDTFIKGSPVFAGDIIPDMDKAEFRTLKRLHCAEEAAAEKPMPSQPDAVEDGVETDNGKKKKGKKS